jgi:hypothetical protein
MAQTEFHPVPSLPLEGLEYDLPFLSARTPAEIRTEQEAIQKTIKRIASDPASVDAALASLGLLPA